jgi:hypothetical protein
MFLMLSRVIIDRAIFTVINIYANI